MDIVALPSPIGLPSQFASSAPAWQAGQVIEALVLALLENDTVRLSLPGLILDVRSTVPLTPGSTVRLAVQAAGPGLQLVILGDSAHGSGGAAAQAGRTPPSADQTSRGTIPPPAAAEGEALAAPAGQATIVDVGGSRTAAVATAAPETAIAAATAMPAAEAVGQAVRVAAARQGGLAPLIANIEQAVNGNGVPLPRPVLQAALALLDLRVPLNEGLAAGDVRQALAQSGLFLEASLGAPEAPPNAPPSSAGSSPTSSAPAARVLAPSIPLSAAVASAPGDLKAALLVFRQVLKIWLDAAAPAGSGGAPDVPAGPRQAPQPGTPGQPGADMAAKGFARPMAAAVAGAAVGNPQAAPPPPYRGAPPSAQPVAAASIPENAGPGDVAGRLLTQTEAALARHTLLQVASLPDQAHAPGPRGDNQGPQWLFEIPFGTRQGTAMAQFEIGRDGHAAGANGRVVWRARFSLDVEPMGPVHAQVTVVGERAAVTLWAERDASAASLRDSTAALSEALRGAELEPGDIQCRTGAPAPPRPAAGRFLDQAS